MKKFFASIGVLLFTVLLGILFAIMLLEWLAGCGETYTDSKGIKHANECIFLGKK